MKKIRLIRNVICLLVCAAILSGYSTNIKAEEETEYAEAPIYYSDPVYFTNNGSSGISTRGADLMQGTSSWADHGNGYITIVATTEAQGIRDKLYVSSYLQRYSGSSWVTVGSWSNTAYNTHYVNLSAAITVTTGYRYRLYSIFSVTQGGRTESNSVYSESMMVY